MVKRMNAYSSQAKLTCPTYYLDQLIEKSAECAVEVLPSQLSHQQS